MGKQLVGIAAICGWSLLTMPPFFYIVGVLISRDWKNPRLGLRHEYDKMDLNVHGCTEDPTDKINEQIRKMLELRDEQYRILNQVGVLTGTKNISRSYMNNLSLSVREEPSDDGSKSPETTIDEEGTEDISC